MTKICTICGIEFEARAPNAKYCPSCRIEAYRQQKNGSYRTKNNPLICQRCGKELSGVRRNTKWCTECRPIVHREQNLRYDAQHPDRTRKGKSADTKVPTFFAFTFSKKQRKCRTCGKDFPAQGNEHTCPACKAIQHEKELEQARDRAIKRRILPQKKVDEATGKPVKTLDDWVREADECNLDYGTYRALIAAGKTFEQLKAERRNPQTHSHCRHFYNF